MYGVQYYCYLLHTLRSPTVDMSSERRRPAPNLPRHSSPPILVEIGATMAMFHIFSSLRPSERLYISPLTRSSSRIVSRNPLFPWAVRSKPLRDEKTSTVLKIVPSPMAAASFHHGRPRPRSDAKFALCSALPERHLQGPGEW